VERVLGILLGALAVELVVIGLRQVGLMASHGP
jgi:hypothetical protein